MSFMLVLSIPFGEPRGHLNRRGHVRLLCPVRPIRQPEVLAVLTPR